MVLQILFRTFLFILFGWLVMKNYQSHQSKGQTSFSRLEIGKKRELKANKGAKDSVDTL